MLFKSRIMPFVYLIFAVCMSSVLLPTPSTANEYSTADKSTVSESVQSKRIEVYTLSQNYWDTRIGETLGEIVVQLLPNNPSKRAALKQDIVNLNPHAFINADPARMLADKRLRLPGQMNQADSIPPSEITNSPTTTVESYSWGHIKRSNE